MSNNVDARAILFFYIRQLKTLTGQFERTSKFWSRASLAVTYEIVWFQSLQMVVGASAISLAVLLTIFMGGMCLGSLLFPKLIPTKWHPLGVYASLEFMIGVLAIALLYAMPFIEHFYVERVGPGNTGVMLRAISAGPWSI